MVSCLRDSVTKKPFCNRIRGVRRGGVESGLLKMGIEEERFFNVLVSKNSRNFYGNFYFQPGCISIY